jgi:SAM-dependent methyltransferase
MSVVVSEFESSQYWEQRYSSPSKRHGAFFDWYQVRFPGKLEQLVAKAVQEHAPELLTRSTASSPFTVVDVGCGNSQLLLEVAESAFGKTLEAAHNHVRYVGVDVSHAAVQLQQENHRAKQKRSSTTTDSQDSTSSKSVEFEFYQCSLIEPIAFGNAETVDKEPLQEGTAREPSTLGNAIPMASGSVAIVIDKATCDCIDCSGDPNHVAETLRNVHRFLSVSNGEHTKPDAAGQASSTGKGLFFCVTCRSPERRLESIPRDLFDVLAINSLENDPIAPSQLIVCRPVTKV